MTLPYKPQARQEAILERAMEHVEGVPYRVTARWLFYRLLQDGFYSAKGDYKNRFLPILSKARKRFYNGWHPDLLADDSREAMVRGRGYASEGAWLRAIGKGIKCSLDKWGDQDNYVEIWCEAHAMRGQFEYHTDYITIAPFGGDPSIPYKWAIAKRLEKRAERYGNPVVVLYFGDYDPKGLMIPESAAIDIRAWCYSDFEFLRCALNSGDELTYSIPENPDKPGQYQWEALTDEAAETVIAENVNRFVSTDKFAQIEEEEKDAEARFSDRWAAFMADGA